VLTTCRASLSLARLFQQISLVTSPLPPFSTATARSRVLCSTLLLFRYPTWTRVKILLQGANLQETKNPRASLAISGSVHKLGL
jgi:hypothetical protein